MDALRFTFANAPARDKAPATDPIRLRLVPDATDHAVDRRYLSFSMDMADLVGAGLTEAVGAGFERPTVVALTRALGPAYLHLGGPSADRTFYELRGRAKTPPAGFDGTLTAGKWDALVGFVQDAGLALIFTLNAGPGARGRAGEWRPEQASLLIDHAAARRDPVLVWSFGHSAEHLPTYAEDVRTARALVRDRCRGSLLAAPAGDLDLTDPDHGPDIVTWSYVPKAAPAEPACRELNAIATVAADVEAKVATGQPRRPMWLTDASFAEAPPGLGSVLRWVDQLGRVAQRGHAVVVRRPLLGGPGALIDRDTERPSPDYWASVLWKRLMGREVVAPARADDAEDERVRAYAHWTPPGGGIPDECVTLLLLNLGATAAHVELPHLPCQTALAFRFTASAWGGSEVRLNGRALPVASPEAPTTILAHVESFDHGRARLDLAPRSFGFFVLAPTGARFDA